MRRINRILSKVRHALRPSDSSSRNATLESDYLATADDTGIAQTDEHTEPVRVNVQGDCLLENLPPEVRRHILYVIGIEDIRALVHASPVFLQQYVLDRKALLSKSLETMLGDVVVDACAAYQSGWIAAYESGWGTDGDLCTEDDVIHFLESYQNRRRLPQHPNVMALLTEHQVANVVAFHISVVEPLVRLYTSWALFNLINQDEDLKGQKPLSKMEETRVFRAFYRLQLCCNLFAKGRHRTFWSHKPRFNSLEILRLFFCPFEPWEAEEIACIYTFAKQKYSQIFSEIRWDVHKDNPKFEFDPYPPKPRGAFDLDDEYDRQNLLVGTISNGLNLLHTVCCATEDHRHLVWTMQDSMGYLGGPFLETEALGKTTQYNRWEEWPSERDEKQRRGDPMLFRGDGEPDEQGERPPLAWTLVWREKYANLYGDFVKDDVRRLGYVMWDAARLEESGAKDRLLQLWDKEWEGVDPNDVF